MKTNYDLKMQEELKNLGDSKPKLLLHVCCGPCCSNIVLELKEYFDITIYYSNSNIYPKEEYDRRLDELKKFIRQFNQDYNENIEIFEDRYDHEDWYDNEYPLKDLPEGSMRCHLCYGLRMRRAYDFACLNHFDYWTTVMSVSPHKDSQVINQIGQQWQDVKFLYADFKKRDGFLKSTQMASKYGMYRQNYCGCEFSYREMLEREERKEKREESSQ